MDYNEWIAINYTLPREPSRARVSIWRKLKKIGAVSIQQSMWILSSNDENCNLLKEIKNEVSQNGGEAFIMVVSVDEDGKKMIIEKFNTARNEEYGELLEQCEDFFKEIDKEIARENFTFAEIEENEEELSKLKEWYKKITARDSFGAPLQEKAKLMLSKCAEVLDDFCDKVYDFNEKRRELK
ncbi:Chromate resistance protein ChrB [Oscillospiraceae bacterium PP1C4]